MMNPNTYKNLLEFITLHFCQTFRLDEYPSQVKFYNLYSTKEERLKLKKEALHLYNNYSWDRIKWFLDRYCGRRPKNEEAVKYLFETILNNIDA